MLFGGWLPVIGISTTKEESGMLAAEWEAWLKVA